ncbi:MAG TPA: hypothetical protein VFH04_05670 [Nitrososphaeraceae archaeon]|nr:hypothetical protein [Nitrososphaeraceae archaeon]
MARFRSEKTSGRVNPNKKPRVTGKPHKTPTPAPTINGNRTIERIQRRKLEAKNSIRNLISSSNITIEQRVSIEHRLLTIFTESESFLELIGSFRKDAQIKILKAYRKFSEINIDAIDELSRGLRRQ